MNAYVIPCDEFGRIRDVNVAPDGSIWLLTDENPGAIVRISRAD
jgi:glucose/arabinose dehydrogenase